MNDFDDDVSNNLETKIKAFDEFIVKFRNQNTEDYNAEVKLFSVLASIAPNVSTTEHLINIELEKLFAAYDNQTLTRYLDEHFDDVIASHKKAYELENQNDVLGAAVFNLITGKAQLAGSENADGITVAHELTHVFTKTLRGKHLDDFNAVFAGDHEAAAASLEQYLLFAEAPTPELKDLFDKFKSCMRNCTNIAEVEHELTPEQKRYWNSVFMTAQENINFDLLHAPTQDEKLTNANNRFNQDIDYFMTNSLPKGYVFSLGEPTGILELSGCPKTNIELLPSQLELKSKHKNHPFSPTEIKNLVTALHEPVGVFKYGNSQKARNVIVDLTSKDKNFLVGIHFFDKNNKTIATIQGLYPKDNPEWLNWISDKQKQLSNGWIYLNKEKIQTIVDVTKLNASTPAYLDLDSINILLQKNKDVKHIFNPDFIKQTYEILYKRGAKLPKYQSELDFTAQKQPEIAPETPSPALQPEIAPETPSPAPMREEAAPERERETERLAAEQLALFESIDLDAEYEKMSLERNLQSLLRYNAILKDVREHPSEPFADDNDIELLHAFHENNWGRPFFMEGVGYSDEEARQDLIDATQRQLSAQTDFIIKQFAKELSPALAQKIYNIGHETQNEEEIETQARVEEEEEAEEAEEYIEEPEAAPEPEIKDEPEPEPAETLVTEVEPNPAEIPEVKNEPAIETPETTYETQAQSISESVLQTETARQSEIEVEPHNDTVPEVKPAPEVSEPEQGYKPFGAWVDFGARLSTSERERANAAAIALIQSKNGAELTESERAVAAKYSGFGHIKADNERGVLYDFYTSPPVADLTWKLLDKIEPLRNREMILEPSCGTGVFLETAPRNVHITGVEIDGRTASIARALRKPVRGLIASDVRERTIINQSFEQFNLSNKAGGYDRVIGNAPFGMRPADTAALDMPDVHSLDNYFVRRSIDNLRGGGTMALIVAPGVLANKTNTDFRTELCRRARFLGAVKLPNKSFEHTGAQVEPDILLFRKHPEDVIARLENIPDALFKTLPVYDKTFIEGKYFEVYPDNIMGTISKGAGQWGADVVEGEVTPDSMNRILRAFVSREDVSRLNFEEIRQRFPEPVRGNEKSFKLSDAELEALGRREIAAGTVKVTETDVCVLTAGHKWKSISEDKILMGKVEAVKVISDRITSIRTMMEEGGKADKNSQDEAKNLLESFKNKFGAYPRDDSDITKLVRDNPAVKGIYEAFVTPDSDVLNKENIIESGVEYSDGHNPAIKALQELEEKLIPATEEAIRREFPQTANSILEECKKNTGIFITPEGEWQLREDFVSGDGWAKIDELRLEAAAETNAAVKEKLLYGAAEIEKAVGWMPIDDVDYSPQSTWIPHNIITDWVTNEDGLDRKDLRSLKYAEYTEQKSKSYKWQYYDAQKNKDSKYDTVCYYLNGEKQRGRDSPLTDTINNNYNEQFRGFISNHPIYRKQLEETFNRVFNTEIKAPVKTYPVSIEGWRGAKFNDAGRRVAGKDIKPHQWQTIHQLYRQGVGISALGTGFGKTLSGIGLMSLMRQEGKLNRVWLQVPNNKVKDWGAEIRDVMPHLKLAYIDPEEKSYNNRDKRYARFHTMAASKVDVIIMPESAASEIQLRGENNKIVTERIIDEYLEQALDDGKTSQRALMQAELRGLSKAVDGKTNAVISFEDFGCDAIFVDEAHNYKNLFTSSLARDTGIADGRHSARAMSLFKKTEYIRRVHNDKNVFLFTATPLTNSPLEYYNMLQYIAPQELKKFGIHRIDGFIKEFAIVEKETVIDWAKHSSSENGKTKYETKEKNVLKGFRNLPALQKMFFKFTDSQNDSKAIGLVKPDSKNIPNVIEKNEKQVAAIKTITADLDSWTKLEPEEKKLSGQNYLTFYTQLRAASLDLELYDRDTYKDWKNPKLEKLSRNARGLYRRTGAGQVVFCDRVFSSDYQFNIHDKIKASLVEQGFKPYEIVIVNGFTKSGADKTDASIEKEVSAAIEGFNNGKYKVIIGSTECMGEGVNLQGNASGLHHFDIPYRPSDFIQRNGRIDRQGNAQNNVELHSYASIGTMDNYSMSLVQRKQDWINQLLRTKESVFTNPDNENDVPIQDILLALDEEWGNAEQAEARRQEIARQKAEAAAQVNIERKKNLLASLSRLRCSASLNTDAESKEYKASTAKLNQIADALRANPAFDDAALLENNNPFLYNKELDRAFMTGDAFVHGKTIYRIDALNAKKQSFICTSLDTNDTISFNVQRDFRSDSYDKLEAYFRKPTEHDIEVMNSIASADFYFKTNTEERARFYELHLHTINVYSGNIKNFFIFTKDKKGKLEIEHNPSYSYQFEGLVNPFTPDGVKSIHDSLKNQIEYNHYKVNELKEYLSKYMPHIADNVLPRIELQENIKTEVNAEFENSGRPANYSTSDERKALADERIAAALAERYGSPAQNEAAPATNPSLEPHNAARNINAIQENKIMAEQEKKNVNNLVPPDVFRKRAYAITQAGSETQFKTLLKYAIEDNKVPWQNPVAPGTQPPHNPITEKPMQGFNLLQASLHQTLLRTPDPRYVTAKQLQEGMSIKPNAIPLQLQFSDKNAKGEWENKTVTYFNCSQIEGCEKYKRPEKTTDAVVEQKSCSNPKEQCGADMASYMTALNSGKGFSPQPLNRDNQMLAELKMFDLRKIGRDAKEMSNQALKPQREQTQERTQQRSQGQAMA